MTKRHITIATRESPLALEQTESVKRLLQEQYPTLSVDFLGITTQADKQLDVVLTDIGGKGLFVKELEEALYDGRADIAVHSMKDVPMDLPQGLILPVIGEREDARDAFVSNKYASLMALPAGAVVGTSSLRRQTQLHAIRPDVEWRNLRGNINTRLRKLDDGEYDAIILAAAGLKRMGFADRIREVIPSWESLPSAGQGALGIECRASDSSVIELITPLNNEKTNLCVTAERAMCRRIGGGCKVPVAAYAQINNGVLTLRGLVANKDGTRFLRAHRDGDPNDPESIGLDAAEDLLQQGAAEILKEFQ